MNTVSSYKNGGRRHTLILKEAIMILPLLDALKTTFALKTL